MVGGTDMITNRIIAGVIAASLIAFPAMASAASENNGHHYSGGPKTEVPHHMGKKETVGMSGGPKTEVPHHMGKKETVGMSATPKDTGGHHYRGGPSTSVPHHMGDKQ
jgi:hypothetical protein